ncbi:MAG: type II toxin-antitoxin system Phd/YefM family antitoxin [Stellaceae bacterium]
MTAARKKPLPTAAARDNFAEMVNRAAYGGERVLVSRRGKPLAAIVPLTDVEAMEAFEDELDSAIIRKRTAEWERAGRPGITLEEYARKHGIRLKRNRK